MLEANKHQRLYREKIHIREGNFPVAIINENFQSHHDLIS